jgi:hypothetical protein
MSPSLTQPAISVNSKSGSGLARPRKGLSIRIKLAAAFMAIMTGIVALSRDHLPLLFLPLPMMLQLLLNFVLGRTYRYFPFGFPFDLLLICLIFFLITVIHYFSHFCLIVK